MRSSSGTPGRDGARNPGRLAVLDVGSNTARLVLFRTGRAGGIRAMAEWKEVPRLGLEPAPDGTLREAAMERGVAALVRFGRILDEIGPDRVFAVATSAVRDAPNAAEFLRRVRQASGLELRILSGAEEARYAYLGVASAWELGHALVCDLGGGSLQIVETSPERLKNSVSLPLGALRLHHRYLAHDPPKSREWEELRAAVREALEASLSAFGGGPYELIGLGGTVRAMARAAIELRSYPFPRVHGYALRARDLQALHELLGEMPAERRRSVPGIGSDRADVILVGLVLFEALLRAARAPGITVSGTGIREGIALEAIGAKLPAPADELAHRSVSVLAETVGFDLEEGEQVAEIATELLDLAAGPGGSDPSERRALRVAGWMRGAGTAIDLWRYARHSAYLVRNVPIHGLSPREVLLAALALDGGEEVAPGAGGKKEGILGRGAADRSTARRLGGYLQAAAWLRPARPRFTVTEAGKTLSVAMDPVRAAMLSPRALEKARKLLEREMDREVVFLGS
ncbi:MAG: Ppx/GppA phosphatase family protein [Thermoplasmata archaeon]